MIGSGEYSRPFFVRKFCNRRVDLLLMKLPVRACFSVTLKTAKMSQSVASARFISSSRSSSLTFPSHRTQGLTCLTTVRFAASRSVPLPDDQRRCCASLTAAAKPAPPAPPNAPPPPPPPPFPPRPPRPPRPPPGGGEG